jgi:hypothetical protein
MNITQGILHAVEEGKARVLTRIIPFAVTLLVIFLCYNFRVFNGLDDAQSMDNAQVARQIARGDGFTTKFIRPYALGQLNSLAQKRPAAQDRELFPAAKFPKGTERILPDTYNAPGYPYLLAGWFKLLNSKFDEAPRDIATARTYGPDHAIPWLNQIFLFLNAALIFILGWRLFDERVAWMAMTAFLLTDIVWQYSITALPTTGLMCLTTLVLFATVEIFSVGEACFESTEAPFWPAWLWTLLLAVILGLISLTRLHLLVLLLPLALFFLSVPRSSFWLILVLVVVVLGMVVPWFWHMYFISGSLIGSNIPFLHYGSEGFEGNQIYGVLGAPDYNQLFKDIAGKEFIGFGWNFAHAWSLLGTNPIVLLFFVSTLHSFKRPRVQALRWLIVGAAFSIIAANNFGSPHPENLDPWNNLVILLPGMLVVGSAFFFILVDRLHFPLWILNNAITITMLVLVALPMIGALLDARGNRTYPPYSPPALRAIGNYVHTEDWITTDMPWASAWYGDHTSLWLPDTLLDFEEIYDDYNNSGLLVLTPVTLQAPASTLTSGEYKDWMPFITGVNIPPHFPLDSRAPSGAGMIEYFIWGRRG